jgi:hypothetical protein
MLTKQSCVCAAIIALLTDFVTLADLVSLGTLSVFLLLYQRSSRLSHDKAWRLLAMGCCDVSQC